MILQALLLSLGFNIFMFFFAFAFKTDKLTDLSYSLTFIALAVIALLTQPFTLGLAALIGMILIWAIRLGTFLFIRINYQKKDDRFDEMRGSFIKFLGFWLLQAITVWVVILPLFLFTGKAIYIGALIWLAGLIIESAADWQKFSFKNKKANAKKFISTGLWKYSRHPNYFGEMLCWIGVYVYVGSWLYGLISPIYIILLLSFLSGIPLLEKKANKTWGKNKDYQEYKRTTSLLIPWCKKK